MTAEEILIAEAAAETLERIRRDRRDACAQVVPLLEKIEERLLDDELRIGLLRQWCEVNDKNVSTLFARDLGLAPWDYVTDCRIEVAERLLAGSDLKVWEIASIVGYAAAQSFSRAYRRLRGCRPTEYQQAARAARSSEPEPASCTVIPADPPAAGSRRAGVATAARPGDLEASVRALARDLGPERAGELLHRLRAFGHRLQDSWAEISVFLSAMELLFDKERREQGPGEPAGSAS